MTFPRGNVTTVAGVSKKPLGFSFLLIELSKLEKLGLVSTANSGGENELPPSAVVC